LENDSVYLNCHIKTTYSAQVVSSYAASHLESTVVGVMLDSVYVGEKTSGGTGLVDVTKDGYTFTVDFIAVGLSKTTIVGLLDVEGGSQAGTSQGKKKRVSETVVRVNESWYFKTASATQVTNDTENLSASVEPTSSDYRRITPAQAIIDPDLDPIPTNPVPFPITFVSGDIAFSSDDSYDGGGQQQIVQDEPYPLNITCVMHKVNTNE